jgi:hypothetical protein
MNCTSCCFCFQIWSVLSFLLFAHLDKGTEFIFEVEASTNQIQLLWMKGYQENDDYQKAYAVQYDSKLWGRVGESILHILQV